MKNRISKILREEGMTATKFANEIGVQASSISHIISGRNKPSTDFLVKLLERFRGINAEWLLTGKGSMYKEIASNVFPKSDEITPINNDLFSSKPVINDFEDKNGEDITSDLIENDKNLIENHENEPDLSKNSQKIIQNNVKKSKIIEKVVVFFTDKTFESYDPN